LDLASWRLPKEGFYYARFPFDLPEAEEIRHPPSAIRHPEYVLYYLGRIPGCLASPIEWSIDDGPAAEVVAPDGWNAPGQLTQTEWFKYGVIRLGTFTAGPGRHTVTITVRKVAYDWIEHLYSQQIDALGIAPTSWPVEPAAPPDPRRKPGDWTPEPQTPRQPTLDTPGSHPLVIRSNNLELRISPTNAGIRGILLQGERRPSAISHQPSAISHRWTIPLALSSPAGPLLKVDFRDGSAQDGGRVVKVVKGPHQVALHCRNAGVEAVLTFSAETRDLDGLAQRPRPDDASAGEIRLVAQITNRAQTPIWRVRLLVAGGGGEVPSSASGEGWGGGGLGLHGDAADDTWIVAQDILPPEQVVGYQRRISPCRFSFDWVCVHDATATFYALFEDRQLLDTEVEFGRAGSGDPRPTGREDRGGPHGPLATLAFAKFPRIRPGETWTSPPLVLGAYRGGDWHRAGDRFSRWWYGWARSPRIPAWLTRLGGMTLGFDVHGEKALENNRALLEATRKGSGITAYHGASWISDTTECWYPVQYHLSPDQLRRLREVTDALRQMGGRTSIYTNALMFSRASPAFELWGRDLATVANDGRLWFTEHHTHHHPMALPYPNERWAVHYVQVMEEAVLLGRPDLLYIDQLGAVPAHLDFDPDRHGHLHYGEWTAGSVRFLRTVQEQLCSRYPDLATYVECPTPALLQYTHLSMYGTTPVLRYVFPTYRGFVGPYRVVEPPAALDLARTALLTGEPLLLLDARLEQAEEAIRQAIRGLILLKQRVDPRLYRARYRDTVGLTVPDGIRASVFGAHGRLFVPFVRVKEGAAGRLVCDPAALEVQVEGKARVFSVKAPDQPRPFSASRAANGSLEIPVPSDEAGVIEVR